MSHEPCRLVSRALSIRLSCNALMDFLDEQRMKIAMSHLLIRHVRILKNRPNGHRELLAASTAFIQALALCLLPAFGFSL